MPQRRSVVVASATSGSGVTEAVAGRRFEATRSGDPERRSFGAKETLWQGKKAGGAMSSLAGGGGVAPLPDA